jgi:hypothetical protein
MINDLPNKSSAHAPTTLFPLDVLLSQHAKYKFQLVLLSLAISVISGDSVH